MTYPKNAILVPGWVQRDIFFDPKYPTPSNMHWFPWLSKQLMIRDIQTVALEMPQSYAPNYNVWKKELERFDITDQTILVGHSCGGGFLVRWLSENQDIKVNQVVLVAPWLGFNSDQEFDKNFFDFKIDPDIANHANKFVLFNSSNDMPEVHKSVDVIRDNLKNIKYIELLDKGHFTFKDLGSEEFPELLGEILL